jgi:hypothetical protein
MFDNWLDKDKEYIKQNIKEGQKKIEKINDEYYIKI